MTSAVGLDLGNTKIAAARWAAPGGARMLPAREGVPFVRSAVSFAEMMRGKERSVEGSFPVDADITTSARLLLFSELKSSLPLYGEPATQQFVMAPMFDFWRRTVGSGAATVSVSTPFEYTWDINQALAAAARASGFESCNPVLEPLAAFLAHVPGLRNDLPRRDSLRRGAHVWVVDCGAFDLTITLLHVLMQGDGLSVSFLAADSLDNVSGAARADATPRERLLADSVQRLQRSAASARSSSKSGPAPKSGEHAWIVPCGGGSLLPTFIDIISSLLPGAMPLEEIRPFEAVALGAAVHAAMLSNQFPLRLSTVKRWVVGVKAQDPGAPFAPVTSEREEPQCYAERAFRLTTSRDVPAIISLAAALPGGARCAGLWSHALEHRDGRESRTVLVAVDLVSWGGGTVRVTDLESGTTLAEARFKLP